MKGLRQRRSRQSGFTLVEVMIVTSIIAMIAAMSLPAIKRAYKRSQAAVIKEDLRILDAALGQFASENNKFSGVEVDFTDLVPYLASGSNLAKTGSDSLGNAYGPFFVDEVPHLPEATYEAL